MKFLSTQIICLGEIIERDNLLRGRMMVFPVVYLFYEGH